MHACCGAAPPKHARMCDDAERPWEGEEKEGREKASRSKEVKARVKYMDRRGWRGNRRERKTIAFSFRDGADGSAHGFIRHLRVTLLMRVVETGRLDKREERGEERKRERKKRK